MLLLGGFGTVSWWERLQIFGEICAGIVSRDDPSKEEIESLKSGDLLEQVISGLSKLPHKFIMY